MRLRVFHSAQYIYPSPITESHHELRLMPLSDADQSCLDFRLRIDPPARVFAYDLPSGRVHYFNLRAPHSELTVTSESLVVTHRHDPFANLDLRSDDSDFYRRDDVRERYIEYLLPTARVPLHPETDRIAAVARRQVSGGGGTASFLIALIRLLRRVYAVAPETTRVNPTLLEALQRKQDLCQNFAHLMLAICRRQGIPARFVSGYLYTGGRVSEKSDAAEGETSEMSVRDDAMHAWVECLLPNEQWRGFDPANNLLTNDTYVKVHYGRDYGDVPPMRGVYHGPAFRARLVSVRVQAEG